MCAVTGVFSYSVCLVMERAFDFRDGGVEHGGPHGALRDLVEFWWGQGGGGAELVEHWGVEESVWVRCPSLLGRSGEEMVGFGPAAAAGRYVRCERQGRWGCPCLPLPSEFEDAGEAWLLEVSPWHVPGRAVGWFPGLDEAREHLFGVVDEFCAVLTVEADELHRQFLRRARDQPPGAPWGVVNDYRSVHDFLLGEGPAALRRWLAFLRTELESGSTRPAPP